MGKSARSRFEEEEINTPVTHKHAQDITKYV